MGFSPIIPSIYWRIFPEAENEYLHFPCDWPAVLENIFNTDV